MTKEEGKPRLRLVVSRKELIALVAIVTVVMAGIVVLFWTYTPQPSVPQPTTTTIVTTAKPSGGILDSNFSASDPFNVIGQFGGWVGLMILIAIGVMAMQVLRALLD